MTLDIKQGVSLVAIFLVLFSAAAGMLNSNSYTSAYTPYVWHYSTIQIWDNGTVTPKSAPIRYEGNRYVLTSDIYNGIAVQKSGITIEGNGHKMYGYRGTALLLQNVTDVTVQNLNIMYFSYGIYLENANSSIIKNNTLVNCGIKLIQSNNNHISGNNASKLISVEFSNNTSIIDNVASGITVTWCKNATVSNNILSDVTLGNSTATSGVYTEGISIDNSDSCSLVGNTIERKGLGVNIWYSTNLTFTDNNLRDNQFGFKLLGGNMQTYMHNIDTSNTVNGKPVYFLVNETNFQVPNNAGWIAAVNCKDITIHSWISTPNWDGVLLAYTSKSEISNSNLKENFNALKLINASECTIIQNTLINNQYAALYFEDTTNCTVTQNNIIDNMCFFYIWADSTGNKIVRNNFVGNWTGSINKNLNNQWNDDNEGNYWSCFTGVDIDQNGASDVPFLIDKYSEEKDLIPHMTPYNNGIGVPIQSQTHSMQLAMPYEILNYTITNINGTIWAKIHGTYPMHLTSEIQEQSLFYPIPPNTTNIQIKLDGEELSFSDYSKIDSTALHYTDIGNWQMIHCVANPSSKDFLLEIYYEHPVETINGTYTFLYDLNILPYLSPTSINSVANFNIKLEGDLPSLQVFTTGFTGKWTSVEYNSTTNEGTTIATFDIVSEYGKPLLGDIVFVLSDTIIPELTTWTIMLTLAATTVCIIVIQRKNTNRTNKLTKII
jgi:parallel beta-helix repeat protein